MIDLKPKIHKSYIKRFFIIPLLIILVILFLSWIILWLFSINTYTVSYGVSFSPGYAGSLGLDWKETYQSILKELKPHFIRLAVPWNKVEAKKNLYSFDDIDYMMNEAEKANVKVVLVVGQKIPRWPECFIPPWAKLETTENKQKMLLDYVGTVVNRYKNNNTLEYWQVENEAFIKFAFGECQSYDINSVKHEISLVKKLDANHKIVLTDSGELSTWHEAASQGDILGTTLYRVVRMPNGFIWKYSFIPPAFYKMRARLLGKDEDSFIISELQAEPWFNSDPLSTPIEEQEKTMSIDQFNENIDYATKIGASRAYLWGVEWWYWMKHDKNDSRYWDRAKEVLK